LAPVAGFPLLKKLPLVLVNHIFLLSASKAIPIVPGPDCAVIPVPL